MSQLIHSTPRADGFRMPAEYEPHRQTWMLWPDRPDNWRLGAKPAQKAFAEVANTIARFEPVTVGVNRDSFATARALLDSTIRLIEISSNDAWIRDVGPTFVVNKAGQARGVDWHFNAWGGFASGLYSSWDLDELVAEKVLEIEKFERYKAPFILEGGSIHVDGEGTLLTTEECLLNPNRNPTLTQAQIESHLEQYLNVKKIIWLEKGVYQDETDGHIDNLACFVRPGVVALTWTDDQNDPQYEISAGAYQRLCAATDARGRKLEVHKIHQPGPIFISPEESLGVEVVDGTYPRLSGERLAGSYINFYICNGALIVPAFNDPHDLPAASALQQLFPDRKINIVAAREILLGGGNIHCITQQQPLPDN